MRIREYAAVSSGDEIRLDRERNVIRGVKVLGLKSRNGREYLPRALEGAAAAYEGRPVNVEHGEGPRRYAERIGWLSGVAFRPGEGLYGNLNFNPGHQLAEQLAWDAEHAPLQVGLSHDVLATVARREGVDVVESIDEVTSVDLVGDPATTRGLFESRERGDGAEGSRGGDGGRRRVDGVALGADSARRGRIAEIIERYGADEILAAGRALRGAEVEESTSGGSAVSREQAAVPPAGGARVSTREEFVARLRGG